MGGEGDRCTHVGARHAGRQADGSMLRASSAGGHARPRSRTHSKPFPVHVHPTPCPPTPTPTHPRTTLSPTTRPPTRHNAGCWGEKGTALWCHPPSSTTLMRWGRACATSAPPQVRVQARVAQLKLRRAQRTPAHGKHPRCHVRAATCRTPALPSLHNSPPSAAHTHTHACVHRGAPGRQAVISAGAAARCAVHAVLCTCHASRGWAVSYARLRGCMLSA